MAQAAKAGRRAARDLVHAGGHPKAGCRSPTTGCPPSRASTRCPTSTQRARPTHFFTEHGVPTTFLLTSFYWENFIYFGVGPEARAGRQARADVPDG